MVKVSLTKDVFWGVTIDVNKRYSQTVEQPFHVSMAALDCREKGQGDADGCVSVMLEHNGAEFLLCTLQRSRIFQQKLDLEFARGETLTLYLVGKGTVHLTGYIVADLEEDLAQSEGQDSSSEETEEETQSEEASVDEPCNLDTKASKKSASKAVRNDQDSGDDDDTLEDENDNGDDDEDDDDDDDDDEDYDEDHDDDEKEDDDSEDEDDEDASDDDESPAAKRFKPCSETPKSKNWATKAAKSEQQQKPSTPVRTANQKAGNVQRQVESKDTKATAAAGDTDKKKKKGKSDKAANVSVNSQTSSTASPAVTKLPVPTKTPVTPMPQATPTSSGQRKTLSGGVTAEEIRVGNGPEAKPGKTAHVYYIGQLSSGKVFDKKMSDKPFSFRLGKNEVIKGWDVGVSGMKVGGKRRLVIPPHMGYGKEKAGSIPPNSTLTFDVELKAVS